MKPTKKAVEMSVEELASYIDQSVLKPEFTQDDIRRYIKEGVDYGCKTVCINPSSIDIAKELTKGSKTGICVVCDFPFGTSTTEMKCLEAEVICKQGIDELDMVSNFGWIRSGLWDYVLKDIKSVKDVCRKYNVALKVIFETDALTYEQVAKATEVAIEAGADFAKTSTGFYTGGEYKGATTEVVKLMLDTGKGRIKVKGAAAIRTREHFLELIDLGIDRMGVGFNSTPVVLGLKK